MWFDANERTALDDALTVAGGPAEPEESPPVRKLSDLVPVAIAAGIALVALAGGGLFLLGLRPRPRR